MSLVENSDPQRARMVNLALVGSHSVNGVSTIHSELLKTRLLPDFYRIWPQKFNNKTNGISQRRWLLHANPVLADLICSAIGDDWITDLEALRELEAFSTDAGFQTSFRHVKHSNKENLVALVQSSLRMKLNPDSMFDVQVKRIHAYKRQLLNVLHIIHEYLAWIEGGVRPAVPRVYIFAGKAAPGYWLAKQIIKLIHNVGRVINNDRRARELMTIVFIPDYRISLAEKIMSATDLGEQISTAGTEASGTGNMKMALNGAVLLGTFDGANLEIMEEVGRENMFLFGLKANEVESMRRQKSYRPREYYDRDPRLKRAVDSLLSRSFCPEGADLFAGIFRSLVDEGDEHFHLADLPAYLEAHDRAGTTFADREHWTRMSILNVARIGKFSSDRAVAEYAENIWNLQDQSAKVHRATRTTLARDRTT
jgi:starch phosphorylase